MKFVNVALIDGWKEKLWYKLPPELVSVLGVGDIVLVPFRARQKHAVVRSLSDVVPERIRGKLRDVLAAQVFPCDRLFAEFIEKVARFYFMDSIYLYRRLLSFLNAPERASGHSLICDGLLSEGCCNVTILTNEQKAAVGSICPAILQAEFKATLLYGVTGSGKSEVYKKLIEQAVFAGKSVVFMLPEVGLCVRFYELLRAQLAAEIPIYSFNSATLVSEKRSLWRCLLNQTPCLILGVHLPILLPISNLGLIIVDEEHERGFKEKSHPRLNSKEVAIWRAKHYGIPVVLGSATPSATSFLRVSSGDWNCCRITRRFSGNFPEVRVVSLREKEKRADFWLTEELRASIRSRLDRKEQAIIFINRRGHSFFVQCKACGEVIVCKYCSVSLTLHKVQNSDEFLRCHYCDFMRPMPLYCGECSKGAENFIFKGIGTQRIVSVLQGCFPDARISRADLDSVKKKRAWEDTTKSFYNGEIDILVGTQTLTKGYHFPGVTLVGVVWGDLDLNFPTFDSRETALQQLIQVAGRSGRADRKKSEVIIQTLSDDLIFRRVSEQKYEGFCLQELEMRKTIGYPPFCRLIRVEMRSKNVVVLRKEAKLLAGRMRQTSKKLGLEVSILGPAKPPIHRVRGVEMMNVLLKADSFDVLHRVIGSLDLDFKSSVAFEVLL